MLNGGAHMTSNVLSASSSLTSDDEKPFLSVDGDFDKGVSFSRG